MTLELAPDVAHQVKENAAREGVSESEYLARLMQSAQGTPADNFAVASADPAARVRVLLTKWQEEDGTPLMPPPPNDGTMTPAEARRQQWERENAEMTDEEREEEDRVWDGFLESLNEVRAAQGMRPL